jgi:hypothetical protein
MNLLKILITFIHIQFIILIIYILGSIVKDFFSIKGRDSLSSISLNYSTAFFLITLTMFYSQYLKILNVNMSVLFLNIIVLLLLVRAYLSGILFKKISLFLLNQGLSIFPFFILVPGIYIAFKSGSDFSMISYGNNDVAYYVSVANQFINNGFTNSDLVSENDLNSDAFSNLYFTPTALISFIKVTTQIHILNVAVPILVLFGTYIIISSARLAKIMYPQIGNKTLLTVGLATLFSSLTSYIFSAFFLGHILAIGLSLNLLALILENIKQFNDKRSFIFELIMILSLCYFSYPAFLIPFIFATLGIFLILIIYNKKPLKSSYSPITIGFIISLIVSAGYLPMSLKMLIGLSSGNYGWSIPKLDPFKFLFGLKFIPINYSNKLFLLFWLIFILFLIFSFYFSNITKYQKIQSLIVLSVCSSGVLLIVLRNNFDLTQYTSWKSFSYLLPIFLSLFIPLFSLVHFSLRYLIVAFLGIAIYSTSIFWFDNRPAINFISKDISTLTLPISLYQKDLNINSNSIFETMILTIEIKNNRLYLNSDSYLERSFAEHACILTRSDLVSEIELPKLQKINEGFYLISPNENGIC